MFTTTNIQGDHREESPVIQTQQIDHLSASPYSHARHKTPNLTRVTVEKLHGRCGGEATAVTIHEPEVVAWGDGIERSAAQSHGHVHWCGALLGEGLHGCRQAAECCVRSTANVLVNRLWNAKEPKQFVAP